jgi:hypothetical protein
MNPLDGSACRFASASCSLAFTISCGGVWQLTKPPSTQHPVERMIHKLHLVKRGSYGPISKEGIISILSIILGTSTSVSYSSFYLATVYGYTYASVTSVHKSEGDPLPKVPSGIIRNSEGERVHIVPPRSIGLPASSSFYYYVALP